MVRSQARIGKARIRSVGLHAALVVVAVTLVLLLIGTYRKIDDAARVFEEAAYGPTSAANVQREALRLRIALPDRGASRPVLRELDLRLGVLTRQLDVSQSHDLTGELGPKFHVLTRLLRELELAIAAIEASDGSPASTERAIATADRLELAAKSLYDTSEQRFFRRTAGALDEQRDSRIAIAATLMLLLGLIAFSVLDVRRRMTSRIAQLATFPQLNPAPVLEVGFDGRLSYSNAAAAKLAADVEADSIENLLPGRPQEIGALCKVEGQTTHREVTVRGRILRWTFTRTRGSIHCYCEDVSDARKAAAAVAEAKEYAENLIETANAMIVGLDCEGVVRVVNRATETITGYSREELLGQNWFTLAFSPERGTEAEREFKQWSSGAKPLADATEAVIRTKTAREISMAWQHSEVKQAGRTTGVISFGLDITERRELEAQLRHAQKMEAVGRLAGGIAHDFNNILAAILCYSDELLQNADDPQLVAADARGIADATERAAALTRQLLAFGRKQVLRTKTIDVNDAIRDVAPMLERLLGPTVDLELSLDTRPAPVQVDLTQLEQVLVNLTVNAGDAMAAGGRLVVETRLVDEGRSGVMIAFTDTGEGMSAEVRAQIFDPYYTTKATGSGLGLSTVHGIVEQSGGLIELQTEPGCGARFEIVLPLMGAADDDAVVAVASRARPTGSLLVVEDEPAIRTLVSEALRRAGFDVLTAADPAEALECASTQQIDLLISDIVMPGSSGIDLAQELRRRTPDLPVVFMSGYAEDSMLERLGVDSNTAFIAKPFRMAELIQIARALTDGAEPESAAPAAA